MPGPRNRRSNRPKPQPSPDNVLYGGGFRLGKEAGAQGFSPSPARAGESHVHERTGNRSRFSAICSKDDSVLFAIRFSYAIALPARGRVGGPKGSGVGLGVDAA
jgi:hypothetical protein